MNILESRLYKMVEQVSNYFILNIIWLICSLPVITFFPATAAMFGIVREWSLGKDQQSISKSFWNHFKSNFKSSLLFEGIFLITVLAALIYLNVDILDDLPFLFSVAVYFVFILSGICVLFTTAFIFPVMVHFQLSFILGLKQSFALAIYFFPTSILIICILAITINLILYFPPVIIIGCSFTAHMIFKMCFYKFTVIEKKTLKGVHNKDEN